MNNVINTHTHTHPFNGPLSRTTQVSRYQKGKTNLDFTEARDGERQWHQLGCMQVCTSLQTDNHASTPPVSFLQAGCLPVAQPTASKHWRQWIMLSSIQYNEIISKARTISWRAESEAATVEGHFYWDIVYNITFLVQGYCLQCFDAVGWRTETASGL